MIDFVNLKDRLANESANVLALYPIQGLSSDKIPEWLEAFTDFMCDQPIDHPVYAAMPELKRLAECSGLLHDDEVLEALRMSSHEGFLVHGDWEVRNWVSHSTFYSGPGHTRLFWTYCENIADAFEAVIAAAEADHEENRPKEGAA